MIRLKFEGRKQEFFGLPKFPALTPRTELPIKLNWKPGSFY